MEAKDVIQLYKLFEKNNIEAWIDGGWGIDALLGKQTRPHEDLDIAIDRKDVIKLRSLLKEYQEKPKEGSTEWNFVLYDEKGHEIDVHVFEFDDKKNNVYGIEYPKESLTGEGIINGQAVKCISPEWVIKFHADYEPKDNDLRDIRALCEKFGIEPPENYKKLKNLF